MDTFNLAVGVYAPDFELPGVDKQVHHLSEYQRNFRAVGVIFISNQCPFVRRYLERLKQIQADLAPKKVTLIAINGNESQENIAENLEQMKLFSLEHYLNFPYVRDNNQDVTNAFRAQITPEAFLLDAQGIIRYRGAIDDCPESAQGVKKNYLHEAITAILNGEKVEPNLTTPVGSPLK